MDESGRLKVANLLPERLPGLEAGVKEQRSQDENVWRTKLAWGLIASEVEDAIREVLDCDILDCFAEVWTNARALQEYADPERHPPGERGLIELGERDFVRDLHPVVAVTIGACECMELRFTLSLAAHFSGLHLSVRAPFITGGTAGQAHVSAQLRFLELNLHDPIESRPIPLPGRFSFDPPLEIPARG
jgi:hypothetical protein